MHPTLPADPDQPQPKAKGAAVAAASSGTLSRQVTHGLLWILSTSALQGVLEIVILMVLARLLSPTAFGIVGAGLLMMRIADIVSKFGVGQALVQRKQLETHHVAAALLFFAAWGTLLTAVAVATAPLQADMLRIPELRQIIPVMMVGLIISNMAEVSLALLRRDLRFRVIAATHAASHVVAYGIVGIGLAALGFGFWSLVWAYVAQMIMRAATFMIVSPHPWSLRSGPTGLRDLLAFGSGMTVSRLAIRCAQEADNLVVARMLGAEALGLYRRAYQLSVTPAAFLGNSISTVLFPVAARLDGPEYLGRAYLRGVAGVALIGLPAGAFLAVIAPDLVAVVLGPQWATTAPPMEILSLGFVFYLGQQVAASITAAAGAVFATAWRQVVYALLVMIAALLGLGWGLVGVATGVLTALAVNYALLNHLVLKLTRLGWMPLLRAHVPAARLTLAVGGLAWFARWALVQLGLGPPVVLAVCTATTAAALLVSIRLWPRCLLGAEGLWLLGHILSLLPERRARKIRTVLGIAPVPASDVT